MFLSTIFSAVLIILLSFQSKIPSFIHHSVALKTEFVFLFSLIFAKKQIVNKQTYQSENGWPNQFI